MRIRIVLLAAFLSALVTGRAAAADAEPTAVDFAKQIRPIFKSRCFACHGALKQEGGLRLDSATNARAGGDGGPAIEAGDADASYLIERITAEAESDRMPPEGKPLTAEQIALIKTWIAEGAVIPTVDAAEPDPSAHWAFRAPLKAPLPAGSDPAGNPIDAFIDAQLTAQGLASVEETDRATLLRRVTLDLTGLPPTREELHQFLADNSPGAYERAVERLLTSPQHGVRWARHWMDVWRYSDWYGRRSVPDVMNSYPQIWRWRDWIVNSLNEDKGYDQMVREMLAADELYPEDQEKIVATGFIVRNWFKWNYDTWMRDQVEHTGKAFLGLSYNCCLCHDHKYDPITQAEYFKFRAFFEPLELRQDRMPGEADPGQFQKYIYGRAYGPMKSGMIRIFDEKLDAETLMYRGGDQRLIMKDKPATPPGVPAFLGGESFQVTAIDLPPTSWNPSLRPFVQQEETARRATAVTAAETAVAAAKTTLEQQMPAVKVALADAEAAVVAAQTDDTAAKPAAALAGKQSLLLQARQGRRTLGNPLAGVPVIEGPATVSYLVQIVEDSHFNLQLALDVSQGATGGWVGFENGQIITYQPGGFVQVTAGKYDLKDGRTFQVTLELDVAQNQFALSVARPGSETKLVDKFPSALNGWRAAGNGKQGLFVDARPGSVVLLDDLVFKPANGDAWLTFDFESPAYETTADVGGKQGWVIAEPYSTAPAVSSVIQHWEASDKVRAAELERLIVRRRGQALELGVALADAKLAAAQADVASYAASLAAEKARHIDHAPNAEELARTAANVYRQAVLTVMTSNRIAAEKALADAEALPSANADRAAAITKASAPVAAAQKAEDAARAALAITDTAYAALGPVFPPKSTGRRTALANWIVDRKNPLAARVAVNHIWKHHFGRPLVETTSNFGRNGKAPSHPELLDWLAVELMEHNWSMKHLHRLIVTSRAYRRSSHAPEGHPGFAADPEGRLLWRFASARLEAEVVRDGILFVSGQLEQTLGGEEIDQAQGLTSKRRSLYFSHHGEKRMEFLELFDVASPVECYQRTASILPQQALALSNSDLTRAQARQLTTLLEQTEKLDPTLADDAADKTFITAAFEQILSRAPTAEESAVSVAFLARQREIYVAAQTATPVHRSRESLVHALLNHNDFVTVR